MSDIDVSRIFWAVGSSFNNSNDDKTNYFIENNIWFDGYASDNDYRNIKILDEIKKGDILLIKSSSTKGINHKTTFTKLKAIGTVIEKKNQYTFHIDWLNTNKLPIDFDNISYRKTIEKMRDDEMLEYAKEFINNYTNPAMNNQTYDKYINILKSNYNIILTGAPGTGKTYLAKKIAESMGCSENEIGFVQFHPSYDYTDFVEGLRPIEKDGNIGFERKDGVFKEFCKKAIMQSAHYVHKERNVHHLTNSNYSSHVYINKSNTFRDLLLQIQTDIKKGKIKSLKSPTSHGNFINVNYDNIKDRITFNNQKKTIEESHLELLFNYFKDKNIYNLSGYERQDYFEIISKLTPNTKTIDYTHYACILQELLNRAKNPIDNNNLDLFYEENTKNTESHDSPKNFVFIIDEINRGEISKIFGELFYSIDPGYRGKSDKTLPLSQYHNLIPKGDIFKDGFYVPDNVYIIGTMNDIDRSVESMDFAFRRRFAFIEIKAEDRLSMLDELNDESLKTKATNRLKNINKAISEIECLSPAYHIGASYFLKLNNYGGNFELLWEYHIEGLLREYMRGMRNVDDKIKELKKAYDNESAPNN